MAEGHANGHEHGSVLPRGGLVAVAALLLFTLLVTGLASVTGWRADTPRTAAPELTRELRFREDDGGALAVVNSGAVVARLPANEEGFVRGVLRSLWRQRTLDGVELGAPFHLTRWNDGALSLEDAATGIRIELNAFGPTNVEAFEALLTAEALE